MKVVPLMSAMVMGAVAGMAVDMVLRPKAHPTTNAGKAMQNVTDVVDDMAGVVKDHMQ